MGFIILWKYQETLTHPSAIAMVRYAARTIVGETMHRRGINSN